MLEYSAILGNRFGDLWVGQVLPFFDALFTSPYFWPGVAAAVVAVVIMAKLLK